MLRRRNYTATYITFGFAPSPTLYSSATQDFLRLTGAIFTMSPSSHVHTSSEGPKKKQRTRGECSWPLSQLLEVIPSKVLVTFARSRRVSPFSSFVLDFALSVRLPARCTTYSSSFEMSISCGQAQATAQQCLIASAQIALHTRKHVRMKWALKKYVHWALFT